MSLVETRSARGSHPGSREQVGNRWIPEPPRGTVYPAMAPLDLKGRDANLSTVFAGNIPFAATEEEILELFNSVDGAYERRQPNVVVAVNFIYDRESGRFQGQAYFLYATIALANFAAERLHHRELRGRRLYVTISSCRFNTGNLGGRANQMGTSRGGANIWDCNPMPRARERD